MMRPASTLVAAAVLAGLSLGPTRPTHAQTSGDRTPTNEDIRQACSQNRADLLPSPFTDVSPDHWAYQAVLSLYYCGPYAGQPLERIPARPSSDPEIDPDVSKTL